MRKKIKDIVEYVNIEGDVDWVFLWEIESLLVDDDDRVVKSQKRVFFEIFVIIDELVKNGNFDFGCYEIGLDGDYEFNKIENIKEELKRLKGVAVNDVIGNFKYRLRKIKL